MLSAVFLKVLQGALGFPKTLQGLHKNCKWQLFALCFVCLSLPPLFMALHPHFPPVQALRQWSELGFGAWLQNPGVEVKQPLSSSSSSLVWATSLAGSLCKVPHPDLPHLQLATEASNSPTQHAGLLHLPLSLLQYSISHPGCCSNRAVHRKPRELSWEASVTSPGSIARHASPWF